MGSRNLHLVSFSPHGFDEDRELKLTSRHDFDGVRRGVLVDFDGNRNGFFFLDTVTNLVDCEELTAIFARKRGVVRVEVHR